MPRNADSPESSDGRPRVRDTRQTPLDGRATFPGTKPTPTMGGGGTGGPFAGLFATGVKPKDAGRTLGRFGHLLRSQAASFVLVLVLVLGSSGLSLLASRMIGIAIDRYVVGGDMRGLWRYVQRLVVVYLLSGAASFGQSLIAASASHRVVAELRRQLFGHLQRLPISFFDTHPRGEIMSRLASDVDAVSDTLSTSAVAAISSVVTMVGALVVMLVLSPLMTVVMLVTAPLSTYVARRIAGRSRDLWRRRQGYLGQQNSLVEETVAGHPVVQLYGQEERILQDFGDISTELRKASTSAETWSGIVRPLMTMLGSLSFGVLAVTGGVLVLKGQTSIGVVASFFQFRKQFSEPLAALATLFNTLQSSVAGLERAYEILDVAPEPQDAPGAVALTQGEGDVGFVGVSFGYTPDRTVVKDVSFHVGPGRTLAIVGPTGAGKTTLANLLLRFYDVDQGQITLDGVDITMVTRDSLRQTVGIVLQDTYLQRGTVKENIRYGKLDATDEEIVRVAQLTGADPIIRRLPKGYDTVLGGEGARLSQGQQQILSITRAVLADPRVLILDEATSSVDTLTEANVRKAIGTLLEGRTSLVIAHRLSTIQGADQIIFLDDGQIVEVGSHEELLGKTGRYAALYYSQFSREEMVRRKALDIAGQEDSDTASRPDQESDPAH